MAQEPVLPSVPEPGRVPEQSSVPVREQSCNRPDPSHGCRKQACTAQEQEPTNALPGRVPRHAGQAQEPPNVSTVTGSQAWPPERDLPGAPAKFS